jgi:hypothetical protein
MATTELPREQSVFDRITLARPAVYSWQCACGTTVSGPSESSVLAGQSLHRKKHSIQLRALQAGDSCLAHRIMRPVPAEGWAPGYSCCPSTTPPDGFALELEARKLVAQS